MQCAAAGAPLQQRAAINYRPGRSGGCSGIAVSNTSSLLGVLVETRTLAGMPESIALAQLKELPADSVQLVDVLPPEEYAAEHRRAP